ncbi:hypothetical protein [Pseudonocardia adelaidensis]|uniref:Uncharacterized protein n=1 Tax=Pseudonocardia adelaidensis TaxID=648754 RepID=A0ABP9NYU1_9PSEU
MDATGARTSAGPAGITGTAEDATAGPSRPVGRADATGPLPVQTPADPTGPLPAPQAGTWFDSGSAADTAAQPAVTTDGSPPSWFATGPLPAVRPAADTATPPSGAVAPPAASGLFEPATDPQPATAAPTPPTGTVPVAGPDGAAPPPTGVIPVVGPPPPADPSPPTGAVPVTAPPTPAGLFTPATPPTAGGAADLFTPATPPPPPAAPEPPTGLFAAVAPPPATVPATGPPAPAAPPSPAGPVWPADATGPMPVVGAPGRPPDASAPPAEPAAPQPPPRVPVAPPRTDAWAFVPEPAPPARTDAWSPPADDRRPDGPQAPPPSGGHSTALTMVSSSNTAPTRAKRRAWPLTVVGVLVAVAAGIALVFSVARTNPADLAASAASDAGSWPGAHYQGAVAANDGGEITVDLTVTPDGASGTLSRDGGQATAELLSDQDGAVIRANREWWLYHHPTRADDLAGAWVAAPDTETQEIDPVLHLNGAALADYVRGGQPTRWQALEQQLVEGRSGIVLFDGARRVVVGGEDAHPLLALDVAPNANTPPVPVSRPTEEQLAAVTGAAARVRQEAAPKTLAQLLQERPNVGIQLQPDPLCTAQTCNVTVTVTNSGTAPARGRLEVSADGKVVANHPLDVQPGQVATFTATAPNPQFAQPGAAGRILWETRAVDD